jgi:hypothetical protein
MHVIILHKRLPQHKVLARSLQSKHSQLRRITLAFWPASCTAPTQACISATAAGRVSRLDISCKLPATCKQMSRHTPGYIVRASSSNAASAASPADKRNLPTLLHSISNRSLLSWQPATCSVAIPHLGQCTQMSPALTRLADQHLSC